MFFKPLLIVMSVCYTYYIKDRNNEYDNSEVGTLKHLIGFVNVMHVWLILQVCLYITYPTGKCLARVYNTC